MKPSIIFRVDGGNVYSIAMGHVFRCVRLARVLREANVHCLFLMRNYTEGVNMVKSAGFDLKTIPAYSTDQEEASFILSCIQSKQAILFVDMRTSIKGIIDLARALQVKTIVYEDVCAEALEPNLLINPSPNSTNMYMPGRTEYLLGRNYLILDPACAVYRREFFSPVIKKLFVCFGGADPCNLSSRVIANLLQQPYDFVTDLAVGPAFAHIEVLEKIISNQRGTKDVNLIRGCNELAPLMSRADAAITSGGTIIYEAVAMRLPTLVLPSIDYEARIVSSLIDEGLLMGLTKDTADAGDDELNAIISSFFTDRKNRESCYHVQGICDISRGITAVVERILSLFSGQLNN